jgi:hypothetical protein
VEQASPSGTKFGTLSVEKVNGESIITISMSSCDNCRRTVHPQGFHFSLTDPIEEWPEYCRLFDEIAKYPHVADAAG